MSDTKFTPGPWVAHETGRARSGVPEHEIHWTDDGECVAEVVHGTANAHLIAAAPAMFELFIDLLDNYECGPEVDRKIDAIVAKARGEKS